MEEKIFSKLSQNEKLKAELKKQAEVVSDDDLDGVSGGEHNCFVDSNCYLRSCFSGAQPQSCWTDVKEKYYCYHITKD